MSLASKIEDMANEAEELRSLALAVFQAIYESHTHHSEFEGACHLVFNLAHEHSEHLEALKQEAYEELKARRRSGEHRLDKEEEP